MHGKKALLRKDFGSPVLSLAAKTFKLESPSMYMADL